MGMEAVKKPKTILKNKTEELTLPATETYSEAPIILDRVLVQGQKKKGRYGADNRALAHPHTYKWTCAWQGLECNQWRTIFKKNGTQSNWMDGHEEKKKKEA